MKPLKKLGFLLLALIVVAAAYGQCGKSITWQGRQTQHLDSAGHLLSTDTTPITIHTNDHHLSFTFKDGQGGSDTIEGDVENTTCNWLSPYKEGETCYKALLAKSSGETFETRVSIKASEGKIAIIITLLDHGGLKICIPVEDYQEKS